MEKPTIFQEVEQFSNDQLKDLLKEVWKIANSETPSKVKRSRQLSLLMKSGKIMSIFWYESFSLCKTAVEREILFRIRESKW
jgi:hypothetical protein